MKHEIVKRKPLRVGFPINRILRGTTESGNEFRYVEGYAFVNEWVGDGVNLKRSAMEAAADDYMKFGAVRAMHQPDAVGTAIGEVTVMGEDGTEETLTLGISWDEKGAKIRTKVVDPNAILKLDEGVYRGFSVGVRPTVMRGTDVVACTWPENSLVDRPADVDALIETVRSDDAGRECDVVRYWDDDDNWVSGAFTFNAILGQLQKDDLQNDSRSAFYVLLDSLVSIANNDGGADMMNQSVDEFADYLKTHVIVEFTTERADEAAKLRDSLKGLLTRLKAEDAPVDSDELTRSLTDLQGRLDSESAARVAAVAQETLLRAETARLTTEIGTLKGEVERLKKLPDPAQPKPLKNGYAAVGRQFAANQDAEDGSEVERLQKELTELEASLKAESDPEKRTQGVSRMMVLKSQISQARA